jgi:hypothetical protein
MYFEFESESYWLKRYAGCNCWWLWLKITVLWYSGSFLLGGPVMYLSLHVFPPQDSESFAINAVIF